MQIVLSFILKLKIFVMILQMKLKKDLIHQIIKLIDHSLQVKIGLIKDELSGNIMSEYVVLKTKTYSLFNGGWYCW